MALAVSATGAAMPCRDHEVDCEGSTTGGAPCATDLDCQLNGECHAGVCVCDVAWRGSNCSVLALLPAKLMNGYGHRGSNISSWGGQIVRDPSTGKYVMPVSPNVLSLEREFALDVQYGATGQPRHMHQ